MAMHNEVSHIEGLSEPGFTGQDFRDRMQAAGYAGTPSGEVVALAGSALGAVEMWLGSPAHRDVLLLQTATDIGIGQQGGYWCVDLGQAPSPAPSAANPGDLRLNEMMVDPNGVDVVGEWIEIFNPRNTALQLSGLTIQDSGTTECTISASLVVPAGGLVVLGRNADTSANGGVLVDFLCPLLSLNNSGDEVEIRNGTVLIDHVEYLAPVEPGRTWMYDSNGWCWTPVGVPMPSGDFGTPGQVNTPPFCP
jgi:hypothetical protein